MSDCLKHKILCNYIVCYQCYMELQRRVEKLEKSNVENTMRITRDKKTITELMIEIEKIKKGCKQ